MLVQKGLSVGRGIADVQQVREEAREFTGFCARSTLEACLTGVMENLMACETLPGVPAGVVHAQGSRALYR